MKVATPTSEKWLIEQSRKGNQVAFGQLVDRFSQQVRTTVIGMLGDTAEADDVAQEVFIRFYKSVKDFRGDSKVGTYLTRIAINLSINELNRRKRKGRWLTLFKSGEKDFLPLQIADKSANLERFDTKELIEKSLQILDVDFRAVVILRLIDGYSVKETAEILELPMGTVASRLARGQKKLQQILKNHL